MTKSEWGEIARLVSSTALSAEEEEARAAEAQREERMRERSMELRRSWGETGKVGRESTLQDDL